MRKEEAVSYLANIYAIVEADGISDRIEQSVFEEIAQEIGAGYFERKRAMDKSKSDKLPAALKLRWSDQIRNLEDMLFVAHCDGTPDPTEKPAIISYANFLNISRNQLSVIKFQVRHRFSEYSKRRNPD
jgi:tellurite resistance protein